MRQFERADGALYLCALVLPAGLVCAKFAPAGAALGAIGACAILYCIARTAGRHPAGAALPRWFVAARGAWCVWLASYALALVRAVFPAAAGSWAVPAVVAMLAAWAAGKGMGAVRAVGAVTAPFVLALALLVSAFALPQARWGQVAAAPDARGVLAVLSLCLLPGMEPLRRGERAGGACALGIALCALPGAVCLGLLGRAQTAALDVPLYAAAQSVSVLGVMERFEVLLSGALCVSGFCLTAWLLRMGVHGLRGVQFPCRAWALAAAALALSGVSYRAPAWVVPVGNAIFCGLAPLGILLVGVRKKVVEKEEKDVDKSGSV